jgi:hypothetical protein
MAGALGFLTMLLAFYGFAFGATRLLLRRSLWEQYSLEAPWLTGPALVVLVLSLGAYCQPNAVHAWQAWLLLVAGWALSAAVAVWDRRELTQLLRAHWPRCLAIALPALLGSAVMLWFFGGSPWEEIFIPWVGEYLNYAELAATLTGHYQGEPGALPRFVAEHRPIRFGQDLVVATLAQVAHLHPVQVMVPLAMLFRFQQTIVLGLLLCGGFVRRRRQLLTVGLVLLLEAVLLFETRSFATGFLSSNCTMPLYALYLVWLACQQQFRLREGVALLLMNLFFLLTYPEFLLLAKGFELLAITIAWWRRNRQHWHSLVLCNLAVVLLHPLLVYAKGGVLMHVLRCEGEVGWNVIGDPAHQTFQFLANVIGWHYGDLTEDPLQAVPLAGVVAIVVLAQLVVGLVLLARKYRAGLMLLAWGGMVAAIHLKCAANDNYYSAFKILAHTYFVVVLGVAIVLFTVPWRLAGGLVLLLWLALAGYSTSCIVPAVHQRGFFVNFPQLRALVMGSAKGHAVAALTHQNSPWCVLNLISGETGVPVAAVTPLQQWVLRGRGLGPLQECLRCEANGTLFRGLVLVDDDVRQTGQFNADGRALKFECTRIVAGISNLTLCQGRISLATAHEFPPDYWVCADTSKVQLLAGSNVLKVWGSTSGYHRPPYRFLCTAQGHDGWSQSVIINCQGDFEALLELPPAVVGQEIVLEFKEYETFRPSDVIAGSNDTRDLGFILHAVKCVEAPYGQ